MATNELPVEIPVLYPGLNTMVIGITGHRDLPDSDAIREAVLKTMARLDVLLPGSHQYEVLSAAAEGADRLVANSILEWQAEECSTGSTVSLRIILPMPESNYLRTFREPDTDQSNRDFQEFLRKSTSISVFPVPLEEPATDLAAFYSNREKRRDAYLRNGQLIADHCQVLIAVWDGKPARGRGGTAEIVDYARSKGISIIHIDSGSGRAHWPALGDDYLSQLQLLSDYNNAKVDVPQITAAAQRQLQKLANQLKRASLPESLSDPLAPAILPHMVKSSTLAKRYRALHLWGGTIGYCAAAIAVFVAAFLSLRCANHWYYLLEVIPIIVVGIVVIALKTQGWQRRWIDYRYLAEGLRSSCFLLIAGFGMQKPESFPDLKLHNLPEGWLTIAENQLCGAPKAAAAMPSSNTGQPQGNVNAMGQFLRENWIKAQQEYYEQSSEKNHRYDERIERFTLGALFVTLVVALAHTFFGDFFERLHADFYMNLAAVTLPAFASALAGISVHWHFARNSERYLSMSHHLGQISDEIQKGIDSPVSGRPPLTLQLLELLVLEGDRAMAHEHEGWRTVFGVRLPGP